MIESALPCLRQFLATKNPLKVMENAFCLTLKTHFVLKIFSLFGHVEKCLDKKDKVNFKICDVSTWLSHRLKAIRQ